MTISFFDSIEDRNSIISVSNEYVTYPSSIWMHKQKYHKEVELFFQLLVDADSSEDLLFKIREQKDKNTRMTHLKLFRRCISPVLDTEMTKKVTKVKTEDLIKNYSHTFTPIGRVKSAFFSDDRPKSIGNVMSSKLVFALFGLLGEYDTRGQLGYHLTDEFFSWFESKFNKNLTIEGPRGAGKDIELSSMLSDFKYSYPCDFIIKDSKRRVVAVGFARYDSTRGGAQSDDRTGGNSDKVNKAKSYYEETGKKFKLIFLSDGPGLAHNDIWEENAKLDISWGDNVRVTTLKTLESRVTLEWLTSN